MVGVGLSGVDDAVEWCAYVECGLCVCGMCWLSERFRQVDGVDRRSVESVDALLEPFGSAHRDFLTMGPHPFCLCARWGEVSDDTRCTALSSHDWLATEKVRGVRGMLFWRRGESPSVFGGLCPEVNKGITDYGARE